MSSAFPQETYDEIINHLHTDKAALATCSLVCKSWVPASRYHLYGEIQILLHNCDNVARLLELLASPGRIAPFIRKVNVIGGHGLRVPDSDSEDLELLIDALTILRDTSPRYNSIFLYNPPFQFDRLIEILPLGRLKELSVSLCGADSFHDIVTLLVAMPDLQRLSLVDVMGRFKEPRAIHLNGTMLLPQLYSLTLHAGDAVKFLQLLAPPPKLRWVDFELERPEEVLCIGTFLHSVGPNLEDVRLNCFLDERFIQVMGVRAMTGLRSFHLNLSIFSSGDWQWIPSVLDNITSCVIDHVKFTCYLNPAGNPINNHLAGIPAMMERPNFRHLCKLEFYLRGIRSVEADAKRWVLQELRDLEARDILLISTDLL